MSAQAADLTPGPALAKRVLGIEGGGTKTEWVFGRPGGDGAGLQVESKGLLPASNVKLASDEQLAALFSVMPADATHVGAFLAGCGGETERVRLRRLVAARWPEAHLVIGSDREWAVAAAFHEEDGIVVIAGPGAAVHGRAAGRTEKAGG